MNISELIRLQTEWEQQRGIKNGNWGGDRIQAELDEAKDEPDLYRKLVEYADVLIITTGSIGAVLSALDMAPEQFEQVIKTKLAVNDKKYPLERFQEMPTEEAIAYSRLVWEYLKFQWE